MSASPDFPPASNPNGQSHGPVGPEGMPLGPDGLPLPTDEAALMTEAAQTNPYEMPGHDTEAQRHMAQVALEYAERNALDDQRRAAGSQGIDLATAFEKANSDKRVVAAEDTIKKLYEEGGEADMAERRAKASLNMSLTETEQKAAEDAVSISLFNKTQTKTVEQVAHDVAAGISPLHYAEDQVAQGARSLTEATAQRSALEDRYDGRSEHLLTKVSRKVRHDLASAGIREKVSDLNAKIAEENGRTIGEPDQAVKAAQRLEGEEILSALVDNRPRINSNRRKQIIERLSDHRKDLARAVAYRRQRGGSSRQTAERIGRLYAESGHDGQKAA